MNIKQKQWQLYYLGYYTGNIDGIWGPKSREATLAFQKDFFPNKNAWDSKFGPSTEGKSMEVVDAIQDIVSLYAPQPLDKRYWGLAGKKTMEATKAYQQAVGLPVTGLATKATRETILHTVAPETQEQPENGDWWDDIEFFDKKEFKCKCGGKYCTGYPAEPKELLVRLADRARKHFGAPATVVSGLRCKVHNANCGGVANSQHMYGEAVDLRIKGVSGDKLLAYMKQQPEVRYTYKINATNVHFDIPKGAR